MNEKVKQAFEILKEFLRMTDDDENPTNAFYHEEELNVIETALNDYEEHEKELIAEQHRLFNLAKKQENELKELKKENRSLTKTIAQLTEADYYFITSMALDMLKSNSNFALMYVDDIFCLVDTKNNSFDVIDNYDIDTENISKSKYQKLNELEDFAKIVLSKGIDAPLIKEYPNITYIDYNMKSRFELGTYTKTEFNLVKKVVQKYGK